MVEALRIFVSTYAVLGRRSTVFCVSKALADVHTCPKARPICEVVRFCPRTQRLVQFYCHQCRPGRSSELDGPDQKGRQTISDIACKTARHGNFIVWHSSQPVIPGMDTFKCILHHSSAHDSAREWVGKNVCVVGTSSSGLDTAYDFAHQGIDITLLQRSPTYVMSLIHSVPRGIGNYAPNARDDRANLEEIDRLFFAMSTGPGEELARRNAKELEQLNRDLLEGLNAKGFRTWRGQRGTGNATLSMTGNGGFYFQAGGCKQIIDGKIKIGQGFVERFTKDKVMLNGARQPQFDLVVFATGFLQHDRFDSHDT